jgi:hypothetical protein
VRTLASGRGTSAIMTIEALLRRTSRTAWLVVYISGHGSMQFLRRRAPEAQPHFDGSLRSWFSTGTFELQLC